MADQLLATPPADSSDIHWFAVDRLGQVGVFVTDELAAVPDAATPLQPLASVNFGDLVAPWLADVDPRALSYEVADLFGDLRSDVVSHLFGTSVLDTPPYFDQSLSPALLRLRSREGARERLREVGLHVLPTREGSHAWGHLDSPALRELWREGWIMSAVLAHDVEPWRLGMFHFVYEAPQGSGLEGVYRRWAAPSLPVRVEALPTSLRSRIGATRLADVDFRDCEELYDSDTARATRGRSPSG